MAHSFVCEACLSVVLVDGKGCGFPGCENDKFLVEESEKTVEQNKFELVEKNNTIVPLAIDLLAPTIQKLLTEIILLKQETVVTLKNIALSGALFFKLLEKTHVVVGENVSVFGNFKGEDCIRAGIDFEGLCLLRPAFFPMVENIVCFMENIARMSNSSIRVGKLGRLDLDSFTTSILPKLVLHEENEIKSFILCADKKEHVSEVICTENNSIKLGKVGDLELIGFATSILPKLVLHEENELEELYLSAAESEHVYEITRDTNNNIRVGKVKRLKVNNYAIRILPKLVLHEENVLVMVRLSANKKEQISEVIRAENNSIELRKVKNMKLLNFATSILPKLKLHEENELEELYLCAEGSEHVAEAIREKSDNSWVGKVKRLELLKYAANILPKLKLHKENVMEELYLSADKKEHVSEMIHTKDNSIWLGKMKNVKLLNFAIRTLPKLVLHGENAMEELCLNAAESEHVSGIIHGKSNSARFWNVKKLELMGYAITILPSMMLHKENEMEVFCLDTDKTEEVFEILREKDNSIWLGKVEKMELLGHAINILPKLRLHEENVMEEFLLDTREIRWIHDYEQKFLKGDYPCPRRMKKLVLVNYAFSFLPVLKVHKDNIMEEFCLDVSGISHYSLMPVAEKNTIWLGKMKELVLVNYAVDLFKKILLDREYMMEEIGLYACCLLHVHFLLFGSGSDGIRVGKVRKLKLCTYAVHFLPELVLHEETEMEELWININNFDVYDRLDVENDSICIGRVKKIELCSYAINILPKLILSGSNIEELIISDVGRRWGICFEDPFLFDTEICLWKLKKLKIENSVIDVLKIKMKKRHVLDRFEFVPRKEEKLFYLKTRHFLSRIDIGQVRQGGFFVPEEVRPILKYTLVDEEGNEVVKRKRFFIW
ncbi:MAG: uncharacterized protein A8A55_1510 [Amphiamblys sp. WSBS2006]|nr:MAG: uncharacterized protein A8A55_1510 [Amphiamblys sp. WSBS2006]